VLPPSLSPVRLSNQSNCWCCAALAPIACRNFSPLSIELQLYKSQPGPEICDFLLHHAFSSLVSPFRRPLRPLNLCTLLRARLTLYRGISERDFLPLITFTMGKAGRFACIFTPMALTIASLICLILVFAGQTNKNMSLSRDLYFFKVSLSPLDTAPNIPNVLNQSRG
jgi:hypothetical protein